MKARARDEDKQRTLLVSVAESIGSTLGAIAGKTGSTLETIAEKTGEVERAVTRGPAASAITRAGKKFIQKAKTGARHSRKPANTRRLRTRRASRSAKRTSRRPGGRK